MGEYLKSQSPQELWEASIKPEDLLKPKNPFDPKVWLDSTKGALPQQTAKAPGTGLLIDTTA